MALPTVNFDDFTILLGTTIASTDIFSATDPDGDPITRYRIRDDNGNANSSYWTFNGVIVAPHTWVIIDANALNLLVMNSGTAIAANQFQVQAEAGGQWSVSEVSFAFTVVQNTTRPIVTGADLSVVQSEQILVSQFISASDPDGHPISRFRVLDANPGITSARLEIDGVALTPQQWNYVSVDEWQRLTFVAAQAAPNNDPIWVRAFDRSLGSGSNGQGRWSLPFNINGFTTVNFSRPTGIPTETNIATDERIALSDLFGFFDADNNSIKRVRFFDTVTHIWSGYITENGFQLPAGQFIERDVSALADMEWVAAERSFNEQVRFQVFDGNHWSDIATFRVRTDEKPVIGVAEPYSIRQQSEFVDISNLIQKLDDGPVYSGYQIYDSEDDILSGNFRDGADIYSPLQVHDLTPQEFFDLTFKSGVYDDRSIDEVYVRAFNGTFWSDWSRHTIRTEPEYIDALAALGSWLNFRVPQNGTLTITYSFMQDYPTYGGGPPANEFHQAWDQMRAGIRLGFRSASEFMNVNYEEVPDSVNGPDGLGGTIRIGTYCNVNDTAAAFAYAPGPAEINGDIWFNRAFVGGHVDPPPPMMPCPPAGGGGFLTAWQPGEVNYEIFLHELGHAMGLKHSFEADGNNQPPFLPENTENTQFTLMSYTGGSPHNGLNHQLYDIAALQSYYGERTVFNNTDTVYNRQYMADHPGPGNGNATLNVLFSIWDTGGWDVIDRSAEFTPGNIDLRPGGISNVSGSGTVSIAFGVTLEEARGSIFADTLTGNEAVNRLIGNDGDDTLEGYGGNDMLHGDAGRDTYVYKMFDGHDIINERKGAGRDGIQIGIFNNLDDFTADMSFTRRGFDLIIDFTIDESISRGSITVQNQAFGKDRVESLTMLGTTVDLRYLYENITSPGQQFALTTNPGQYGVLVTPV